MDKKPMDSVIPQVFHEEDLSFVVECPKCKQSRTLNKPCPGCGHWNRYFEAAYMGRVVASPGVDLDYAERKGDTCKDYETLIAQALEWGAVVKPASLKDRLLVAMDLMESWAEGPVSFPLPAAKEKG